MFVKMMTDEQMELLAKQLTAYATISEQLVQSIFSQHDLATGVRLGNLYCEPVLITSGAHKVLKQRWSPSPKQLEILESIFEQGIGTPSKQNIKEITSGLSQLGAQISETNVYNWFQNRRARSKKKQQQKRTKEFQPQQTLVHPGSTSTSTNQIPLYGKNILSNPNVDYHMDG